jgi:hypothetical protein
MADELVRFVVPARIDPDSRAALGLVQVAYELAADDDTDTERRGRLHVILEWIEQHMPEPTRFNKSTSKGWYRRAPRGISWLRSSARPHLTKLRELAALVEVSGLEVREICESRVGYRVYEDDVQVVAEPFGDTRTR